MRQFAAHVQGPSSFRLSCVGDLADALFTGFACGGQLTIGVEHILLAVERSHGAHHMRFDSVHTLPLVERLSLHQQVLNVNLLCLVTIDLRQMVLIYISDIILELSVLFEPIC